MKTIYKVQYLKSEDDEIAYDSYFSSLKKAKEDVELMAFVRGVEVSFDHCGKFYIRVTDKKGATLNRNQSYKDKPFAYAKYIKRIELN